MVILLCSTRTHPPSGDAEKIRPYAITKLVKTTEDALDMSKILHPSDASDFQLSGVPLPRIVCPMPSIESRFTPVIAICDDIKVISFPRTMCASEAMAAESSACVVTVTEDLGEIVGSGDGIIVGISDGLGVGVSVGSGVGCSVGTERGSVGAEVGTDVGIGVGAKVWSA